MLHGLSWFNLDYSFIKEEGEHLMWIAVVPACNEEKSIPLVINNLLGAEVDCIVIVANGCVDQTCTSASSFAKNIPFFHILNYKDPLGIDVPRAIGALFSLKLNPTGIVFVDGDMRGPIISTLKELISGVENGLDMALTNCYPFVSLRSDLATMVLNERELLNRKIGLFNKLGLASPSHGPHAVSNRFLQTVDLEALAIPPLSMAIAAKNQLSIGVSSAISHEKLGSESRDSLHATMIAETIIGDCRQALEYLEGTPLKEVLLNKKDLMGYRSLRRFDLLHEYKQTLNINLRE